MGKCKPREQNKKICCAVEMGLSFRNVSCSEPRIVSIPTKRIAKEPNYRSRELVGHIYKIFVECQFLYTITCFLFDLDVVTVVIFMEWG
jgi:hypothetical protein